MCSVCLHMWNIGIFQFCFYLLWKNIMWNMGFQRPTMFATPTFLVFFEIQNYIIPVFMVTEYLLKNNFIPTSPCKIYWPQQEFYIKVVAQLITHLPWSQLFLNFQSGLRPSHCAKGSFNRICNDLLLVLRFLRQLWFCLIYCCIWFYRTLRTAQPLLSPCVTFELCSN